jgi:hypothetical protein
MMFRKLFLMLKEPGTFFESIRPEGFGPSLLFLFEVSAIIAVFTPIVNYLGWPSTDRTSTYQAQILAWRLTSEYLLPRLGNWAYVLEAALILVFAVVIAVFYAGFLHLIYRVFGGKGPLLNAWKAVCYGAGPSVLLGFIPYWTLFVGAWSLVLQLYFGPKVLYRLREGRALLILALFIGATLLELITKGTTVGFG